jgi:hypothetical protein
VILEGLKFNEERRKCTASYPFFIPPTELKDNYQQVKTYTERMEKRLIKQGRVEEFNSQFRDTVERGVFRELSEEELKVGKVLSTTLPWWRPSRMAHMPPRPCIYA